MSKTALITGVTGQDGAYLAELLLEKGYVVHGIKRRASLFNTDRIDHIYQDPHEKNRRFRLYYGDLTDSMNLTSIIQEVRPDEIYNLGAQTHVKVSFETPEYTANADALGTLRILEAVRLLGMTGTVRIYQASTSELYGLAQQVPQTEQTPFYPRSPYAAAKLYAYWITVNYREAYGVHASNGILFNHESPIRGETFVTRKITRALAKMALGLQGRLYMGNLSARRDWGHAKDYVRAMHLMLQQETPGDYVIATGRHATVREFITMAAEWIGLEIVFSGDGDEEQGVLAGVDEDRFCRRVGEAHLETIKARAGGDAWKTGGDARKTGGDEKKGVDSGQPAVSSDGKTDNILVKVDPMYFRPTEVTALLGDASKARRVLGWEPELTLEDLVADMMAADIALMKQDAWLKKGGYEVKNHFE